MKGWSIGPALAALLMVGVPLPVAAQTAPADRVVVQAPGGAAIGVSIRDLDQEEIAQAGLAEPGGVRIERVEPGSPAERAGLAAGDLVVAFDGVRVRSAREFARLVDETPAGRTVSLTLRREDVSRTVEVTPEARPDALTRALPEVRRELQRGLQNLPQLPEVRRELQRGLQNLPRTFSFDVDLPRAVIAAAPGRLGATLQSIDGQLAEYFGVTAGALVTAVAEESPAAEAGLRAGDVVVSAGGRTVAGVADVTGAIREAGDDASVELGIVRDGESLTITATLPARPRPVRLRGTPIERPLGERQPREPTTFASGHGGPLALSPAEGP